MGQHSQQHGLVPQLPQFDCAWELSDHYKLDIDAHRRRWEVRFRPSLDCERCLHWWTAGVLP